MLDITQYLFQEVEPVYTVLPSTVDEGEFPGGPVVKMGFPSGSVVKNLPGQRERHRFDPGKINPPPCSCLENPMDRGTWWATVHGVAESWT